MKASRRRSGRRGATIIEFAIVVFLLLLVIFASFEFDRLMLAYTTLANSARVGARYAIVHGATRTGTGDPPSGLTDFSNVVNVVRNHAGSGMLRTANVNVVVEYPASTSPSDPGNSRGSAVVVTATYPYDPFTFLPLTITLRSSSRGIIVF
jgi:Flp pilus assembly protein TadG